MLTIISNPKDQAQLDVDRWQRIVRSALARPLKEGLLTLKTVKQATFEKIRDALLESPADIVQFVGHGVYDSGKGYLALVDSGHGGTWVVDDERFAAIFAGVQDRLGLVCLATCESAKSDSPKSFLGIAPRIVQRGVPAVVAMRYPVLVTTAEIFLEDFYKNLAARKPVDWAVQSARNAIAIKVGLGSREFATPVLFMRAKDGNIF
jgi:CHAT domain-containing protein